MCRSIADGGRRCDGKTCWHVNREGHERFLPDTEEERHTMKPAALLSMTKNAIDIRLCRMRKRAREVAAIRTIHGLIQDAPIGPVRREQLWAARAQGAGLALAVRAALIEKAADEERVSAEEVAARFRAEKITPYLQTAGERLAALVTTPDRPDWVDEDRLVRAVEPPENGTPSPAYVRVVTDLDGVERVLVTSYDGSEAMAWAHDRAGLMAAMDEALARIREVNRDPDAYDAWLTAEGVSGTTPAPWTQEMAEGDFLAHSDGMHLV